MNKITLQNFYLRFFRYILLIILSYFSLLLLHTPSICFSQQHVVDIYKEDQDITLYGSDTYDYFGNSVAIGDINSDGKDYLIISAQNADGPNNTRENCGEVYVIYGGNLVTNTEIKNGTDLIIYGMKSSDYAGTSVTVGDINGDDKDDIIIGTPFANAFSNVPVRLRMGAVYIIYGCDNWKKGSIIDLESSQADLTIYGASMSDYFGKITASDINGDNIDDIIISTPFANAGCVYVIYGKKDFGLNYVIDLSSTSADLTIYGADKNDRMGYQLAFGDVNGDNKDDIIIAAQNGYGPGNTRSTCGEVYVIYGRSDFSPNYIMDLSTISPNITIYGADVSDQLGQSVNAGDINGDGKDDIIIGASSANGPSNTRTHCGEVYAIYGRSDFSPNYIMDLSTNSPNITIYGADASDFLGNSVTAGDVNGDNKDDIIIGVPTASGLYNHRMYSGEVVTLYGGDLANTIDLASESSDLIVYGAGRYDAIGSSLATGDINSDDIKDIVIGAPSALGINEKSGQVYIIYGWRPLESPQISINTLDNLIATLNLSVGGDPAEMLISGDITDSFKDTWIPYTTSKEATLTGSEGTKTVTAKFRNALGRESEKCSDTINFAVSGNNLDVITNLFNPERREKAIFKYEINQKNRVKIGLFNLAGELVKKLLDEERPAEIGTIEWNGTNESGKTVTSGIYLLNIEAGSFQKTKKIIVEK